MTETPEAQNQDKTKEAEEETTLPTKPNIPSSGRIKWFMVLIAGLGVFTLIGPPHIKDKFAGFFGYFSNERQCFRYYQTSLHDPSSAYLDSSYTLPKDDARKSDPYFVDGFEHEFDEVLRIKIYAKNKMGAYTSEHFQCLLKKGKYDESATFWWRMQHKG